MPLFVFVGKTSRLWATWHLWAKPHKNARTCTKTLPSGPVFVQSQAWWKILRSLALKGRRFDTWEDIVRAIIAATAYWNTRKHPFR